jgi:hypothetical protein
MSLASRVSALESRVAAFNAGSGGGGSAGTVTYTDNAPAMGATNVQSAIDVLKRFAESFTATSGAVGPSANATLVTLAAIDVTADESLVIEACATFNKDATPGDIIIAIDIDGVPVDNAGSESFGANESGAISRVVQVKPVAGSHVVTLVFASIAGQASVVAGGANVVARRVLA